MNKRAITGWTFLLITFAAVYFGGWILGAFLYVLIYFGLKELIAMLRSKNLFPNIFVAHAGVIVFLLIACTNSLNILAPVAILSMIASFLSILIRGKEARIKDIGATLICILYAGLLPVHFLFLRNMDAGTINLFEKINWFPFIVPNFSLALGFVLLMIVSITVTDVGAYLVGCKFGKHKLCEAISPKKTVEGSLAGTFFAIAFALLNGWLLDLSIWQSFSIGILITLFAQLGDLVESMMKRDAGAKDASDILPGHGGLLDRADSYIFTVAITYYFFYYIVVYPIF